jgi:hypothetical protein
MPLPFAKFDYTAEELEVLEAEEQRLFDLNSRIAEAHQAQAAQAASRVKAFTFGALAATQFRPRATLLARGDLPVLREGHLAELFAVRGIGKTWLVRTLAMLMASGGEAMGFRAPYASRVLHIDGEMASEDLRSRDERLEKVLSLPATWDRNALITVARDWQDGEFHRLDTAEGQAAVEGLVEWADVVVIDNRACLFDPEGETDLVAWQPAQEWLLTLRRRGKAALIVHHGNRKGDARGLGRAEDALDLVIKLERPPNYDASQGARFRLSYEKTRGIPGGEALKPVDYSLTENGWVSDEPGSGGSRQKAKRKLVELVTRQSEIGQPVENKTAAAKLIGINRQTALQVWEELVEEGRITWRDDPAGYHPA